MTPRYLGFPYGLNVAVVPAGSPVMALLRHWQTPEG